MLSLISLAFICVAVLLSLPVGLLLVEVVAALRVAEVKPAHRLVVVADNCTDDTAAVASAAGAEVISRNDPTQIGKGYALGWAINHISMDPPDFVVFVDADCRIQCSAIERLKEVCG